MRRAVSLITLLVSLATVTGACGGPATLPDDVGRAPEDPDDAAILHEYVVDYPSLVVNHEHWHSDNLQGLADYGEQFLTFHRELVKRYDDWRVQHGYPPVGSWDPGTPIPASASHPGRSSEDPSSVDPLCRTPGWLTMEGGGDRNRDFGAGRLVEFTSADQLGRAIDSRGLPNWHSRVHSTIGGDIASAHRVPLDPIFWRFHKFIDRIWQQWEEATDIAAQELHTSPNTDQREPTP